MKVAPIRYGLEDLSSLPSVLADELTILAGHISDCAALTCREHPHSYSHMCQNKNKNPGWPQTWSLSWQQITFSACPEKARLANTIGSTTSLCPDTVRLLWLQTSFACSVASGHTDIQAHFFAQKTSNTTFPSTSEFSQPVVKLRP